MTMAENSTTVKKERNSTIELLRIFCMLAVIAHHCVVHGGAMAMEPCTNKYIASLILPLGKISFTCFVAISMWFLVDQKFKASRFLRAWLEVLFYSVLMMLPTIAFGGQVTAADWMGSFLPIGGNTHGFAATYLAFYLLLPLLNKTIQGFTRSQTLWCLFVLGYVQVFEPILAQFGLANLALHPFVSEIILFGFCFFLSLYLKRWPPKITKSAVSMGSLFSFVWLLVFVITVQGWRVGGDWLVASSVLASWENSILYLMGGFALFLFFNALPPFHSKMVNALASTTFGILLIHDHGFFRYVLWENVVQASSWWHSNIFILLITGWTIAIFAICASIDYIRMRLIERPLMNRPVVMNIIRRVDNVWRGDERNTSCTVSLKKELHLELSSARRIDMPHSMRLEKVVRRGALVVLVATGFFFFVNFITRSEYISSYFSVDWKDTFMDYFNMLECIRKGDPYYADSNYPAIVFVILKLLFHFVPHDALVYFDDPRMEAMGLRETMVAILPFMVLIIVCLFVICVCASRIMEKFSSKTKTTVQFAILLSGPVLFLLERGNVLLFSLTGLLVFFAFYESDNGRVRAIACISLGFASSIKLYPAIFALMLLQKKKYREFAITFVSGLVFLILPFFVFDGFDSMKTMLRGLTLSSDMASWSGFGHNYSFSNFTSIVTTAFGAANINLGLLNTVLPLVGSLLLFAVSKKDWERAFACAFACILIPSFSYTYSLVMLVPSVLLLAADEEPWDGYKLTCGALLLFLMIPIASPVVSSIDALLPEAKFALTWGCLLGNMALLAIAGMIMAHCLGESLRSDAWCSKSDGSRSKAA